MNCTICPKYNRGRGLPECLKCEQYLQFMRDSGKRNTVKIETVPDIILENFADQRTEDIFTLLRILKLDQSLPIMAYYLLGATQIEIAKEFKTSQPVISERIKTGLGILKRSTS